MELGGGDSGLGLDVLEVMCLIGDDKAGLLQNHAVHGLPVLGHLFGFAHFKEHAQDGVSEQQDAASP